MKGWFEKLFSRRQPGRSRAQERDAFMDVELDDSADATPENGTGLLSRLQSGSKRDRQIAALQAGYGELLELIRAIRNHLDSQEKAQTKVLQSMDRFNQTLSLMDQTNRKSAQTMTRLAERTRESEDLLRTMLSRSEKRLSILIGLLLITMLSVLGVGIYFGVTGRVKVNLTEAETPPVALHAPAPAAPAPAESMPAEETTPKEEESMPLIRKEPASPEGKTEDGIFSRKRGFLFFRRSE